MIVRPRILFVVNVDWFFLSHRLPIALAAREAGCDVWIAAANTGEGRRIEQHGFHYVDVPFSRSGMSVPGEMRTAARLVRLYRRARPDLVHHVTIKPVLYGSLAARLTTPPAIVNSITGLGYAFSGAAASFLRPAATATYRLALSLKRSRTIFQNPEDMDAFIDAGIVAAGQARLIRGSGVDCSAFRVMPEPASPPIVLLPARMLREKGVEEFVDAARILRGEGWNARFVLVGDTDTNPTAVPVEELKQWTDEGVVEWWGHRTDMPDILAQAAIVALPTYYKEGLPKSLLEGAAAGRPLIATDIPGCREIVRNGSNGILVPPRDVGALAQALRDLLSDAELRARYGRRGREIVEREFTVEHVVEQTLALYAELLGRRAERMAA